MVTTAKKKAPVKAKAPVVPAKTIANTAAKAVAIRSAEDLKAPVAAANASKSTTKAVAKELAKSVVKPTAKPASKPTAKPTAKVAAKTPVKVATKTTAAAKKSVEASKSAVVAASAKEKVKKPKLVRDSFTMPEAEYAVLGEVKKACIAAGIEVKKSQLLRVGLVLLKKTPISALKSLVEELPPLKAGRPKLG